VERKVEKLSYKISGLDPIQFSWHHQERPSVTLIHLSFRIQHGGHSVFEYLSIRLQMVQALMQRTDFTKTFCFQNATRCSDAPLNVILFTPTTQARLLQSVCYRNLQIRKGVCVRTSCNNFRPNRGMYVESANINSLTPLTQGTAATAPRFLRDSQFFSGSWCENPNFMKPYAICSKYGQIVVCTLK
jgi:hypothetical protein